MEHADAYERILSKEVIPSISNRGIKGFIRIEFMKRKLGNEMEFQTLMWFDDLHAVREFAGENYDSSYVPPVAREILSSFDDRAAHFDILGCVSNTSDTIDKA